MNYIVINDADAEGRRVDGEYDGGNSLDTARKEAAFFVSNTDRGEIRIMRPLKSGALSHVETVRA